MDTKPSVSSETYAPDNLIAGDLHRVTREATIASGADLVRGSVLGVVTASGKYKLSASAADDGSETPAAILVEDAAAAGADATGAIYETGEFNEHALTLGAGHTIGSVRAALRDKNIHLKASTPA